MVSEIHFQLRHRVFSSLTPDPPAAEHLKPEIVELLPHGIT